MRWCPSVARIRVHALMDLTFLFLKRIWSMLRDDVRIAFDEFYTFCIFISYICFLFVTLILKVKNLCSLGDFQTIYLVVYIHV